MTIVHHVFASFRRRTPPWIWQPARALVTALLTPAWFSMRSGHFHSSLRGRAVSPSGRAIPWYTYPAIDFLANRSFAGRAVLEFGAGQSTLWWAERANRVVAFEEDGPWFSRLQPLIPGNVALHRVGEREPAAGIASIRSQLSTHGTAFDIVVIDGLFRSELADLALSVLSPEGAIVCDNAESYGTHEAFVGANLLRVDFAGHAPGVMLPHVTSVYFRPGCFLFDRAWPIAAVAGRHD